MRWLTLALDRAENHPPVSERTTGQIPETIDLPLPPAFIDAIPSILVTAFSVLPQHHIDQLQNVDCQILAEEVQKALTRVSQQDGAGSLLLRLPGLRQLSNLGGSWSADGYNPPGQTPFLPPVGHLLAPPSQLGQHSPSLPQWAPIPATTSNEGRKRKLDKLGTEISQFPLRKRPSQNHSLLPSDGKCFDGFTIS